MQHVQYMLLFLVLVVNFRQLHALTLAACFYYAVRVAIFSTGGKF